MPSAGYSESWVPCRHMDFVDAKKQYVRGTYCVALIFLGRRHLCMLPDRITQGSEGPC